MRHSTKQILAIILFVALFLFVATWYYRSILTLLVVTVFLRKSIRQWLSEHVNNRYAYHSIVLALVLVIGLLMPKPYNFGRVKLYYQDEQGVRTSAPMLQVVCNAIFPEEEIMNIGIHGAVIGGYLMELIPKMKLNNRFVKMAQHDFLHGRIYNFYASANALERNLNTPMSGVYAQAFTQLGIQKSHSVYVIRPKHYDSSKSYPLVVFCHGFLGNWQLYSGIWRDLDNCIVLSIGTDNLSGIFRDKDIKGIFTKQIPFLESLGYKIDRSQMHLIGLSNGYSACCVAYNGYGNKFRSITAISTGSFYTGAGKRTCQINLLGGDDCCGFPVTAKRYQELGMDAACYCEPTDNHFFAVNHRKQMINFLNERLKCTVK